MIEGGLCHDYTTGDQLGDAEAFLSAHAGEVRFVTIDVGGDDIVGCGLSGTLNPTCVQRALEHIVTNMPIILGGLRAAGGESLPIVGMTYYDPILAFYLTGPAGEQTARESVAVLKTLNRDLLKAYRQLPREGGQRREVLRLDRLADDRAPTKAGRCPRTSPTSATGPTCAKPNRTSTPPTTVTK